MRPFIPAVDPFFRRLFLAFLLGQVLLGGLLLLLLTHLPSHEKAAFLTIGEPGEDGPLRLRSLFGSWRIVAAGLAGAVVLAAVFCYVTYLPLKRVSQSVLRMSREMELEGLPPRESRVQLGALMRSLQRIRKSLVDQVRTIDRHRRSLAHLVHTLHDGVIVADPDGRIVLMNAAAARLLDVNADPAHFTQKCEGDPIEAHIPDLRLQLLLKAPAEAGGPIAVESSAVIPRPSDSISDYRFDPSQVQEQKLQLRVDGRPVWVLARSTPIALPSMEGDTPSSSAGRLLVLTEITELIRTIQVKSDFVANASHELRTPLAAIRLGLDAIFGMDPERTPKEAWKQCLDVVNRHTERLADVVEDLLNLYTVESSDKVFDIHAVEVESWLQSVKGRFHERAAEGQVEFRVDNRESATLFANRKLLDLVVDNLLSNAFKFTDEGGSVTLRLERIEGASLLTVADTGCGIPTEEQDRVFERFYQVERSRRRDGRARTHQGTGLGLSIVRHAVSHLNGSVRLTSTLGKGTTVAVAIPQDGKPKAA